MKEKLNKFFKISERGSTIKTEIVAGLTTFFAMAYIVVTNPNQVVGFTFGGAFDTIWGGLGNIFNLFKVGSNKIKKAKNEIKTTDFEIKNYTRVE